MSSSAKTNAISIEMDRVANVLFKKRYLKECKKVNRFMVWLMLAQWVVGIGFALFVSPLTWIGETSSVHLHVWAAVVLGGAISGLSIVWSRCFPDAIHTRHVIAISQMLWSALLIHLSGGRIETHFHVFASLAILSIYRDWKILATATVVVALDHFVRGVFYPLSAFGIATESPYRWFEHTAWVLFEVSFLGPGCVMLRNEIFELCRKQTELEHAKRSVKIQVHDKTAELIAANARLAKKTRETEKLALVAQYTDNVVMITDAETRIEWVNEGFERVTGYTAKEARGKRPLDLLNGPDTAPNQIAEVEKAIAEKRGYDNEMLRYRKNGEPFWMSIEARPIVDETGEYTRFILVESDITARVNADLERQKLNEQLVEASRAAGIAEVATGVLHNVGNVLNSVNVSVLTIEDMNRHSAFEKLEKVCSLIEEHSDEFGNFITDDPRGQKVPEFILKVTDAIRKERNRVTSEFQDLLSNVEHIKEIVAVQQEMANSKGLFQWLDPRKMVDDAITGNKGTLENHNVKVLVEFDDDQHEIHSDKRKILQILINLISNAKDSVVESAVDDPTIEIVLRQVGDSTEFVIRDNGIGFDESQTHKLFRHGHTTKKKGHGFGLHYSANAATELGGTLKAYSKGPGKGAEFVLNLPQGIDSYAEPSANTATV